MEKPPGFLREFSKQQSLPERDALAAEIRAKRTEYFTRKNKVEAAREPVLMEQEIGSEKQAELVQQLEQLARQIEEINDSSFLSKITNFLKLRSLQQQFAQVDSQNDQLSITQAGLSSQVKYDLAVPERQTAPEMQEAEKLLTHFYQQEEQKWQQSPYDPETIAQYFSEAYLSKLSLDEYVRVLRRFPSEMVAHVTRQGVRDHAQLISHQGGLDEFSDSFKQLMADGRLRSPLGVYLAEENKKEAVARFLRLDQYESEKEARYYLAETFDTEEVGTSGSYADRSAVHFATEQVADIFYGSEGGNEIFFAFPSAHIASQFHFAGQLTQDGGGYWNDQWVWANEEKGLNVQSGIVFIPQDAKVDPETGSRYQLDEQNHPIPHDALVKTITDFTHSDQFTLFAQSASSLLGNFRFRWWETNLTEEQEKERNQLLPYIQVLERDWGIVDLRMQKAILSSTNLNQLLQARENEAEGKSGPQYESVEVLAKRALKENAIYYQEAERTISSEEYWKTYFVQHPEQSSNKVVYYEGGDPTKALQDWKKQNKLTRRSTDEHLEFSEHSVKRNSPEANKGKDRFLSLAEEVIAEHFAGKDSV